MEPAWQSCCLYNINFSTKKLPLLIYLLLVQLYLYYDFYKQKNGNRYTQPVCYSCFSHIAIFAIKKAKAVGKVLNKQVFADNISFTTIAISVLQFLQAKK